MAKYGYKFGLGIDPLSPQAKNPKTGIEIEENFGQIYNFNYRKESIVNAPLYELVEALAVGKYYNYTFIPLKISKNDDDTDELKAAKEDLKSKISDTLSKVGTDEEISDNTKFAESIVDNVKKIMDLSPQYQNEIKSRKSSGGNIDVLMISSMINKGLVLRGRIFTFSVNLPDKPGQLVAVSQMLADADANVIKLDHNQFKNLDRFHEVELQVTVETNGEEHIQSIIDTFKKNGYTIKRLNSSEILSE